MHREIARRVAERAAAHVVAGERLLARVRALVHRETARRVAARAAAHVVAGERLLARVRALVHRETVRRVAARAAAHVYRRPVSRTRRGGDSTRALIARATRRRRRMTKTTIDIID